MAYDTDFSRPALLGVGTALRSMTPLAVTGWATMAGRLPARSGLLGRLADPDVAGVLMLMAAGEFVVDKLPFTPARTSPPLWAARIVFAGAAGMITSDTTNTRRDGAVAAATCAVAVPIVTRLRRIIDDHNVPDIIPGLVEDVLAVLSSRRALNV